MALVAGGLVCVLVGDVDTLLFSGVVVVLLLLFSRVEVDLSLVVGRYTCNSLFLTHVLLLSDAFDTRIG